jgi:glucokinase
MILAGDIGGTNTRLALFDGDAPGPAHVETYPSREYEGLEAMVRRFLAEHPATVERAAFGVAGPVHEGIVETTNLAWPVNGPALAGLLGLEEVGLVNDLVANAYGLARLDTDDFRVLNEGDPDASGNVAVISAGTGLGEAGLYWDGDRYHPFASEGGHGDFGPRDELEVDLWRWVLSKYGHASYERVCSGMGLVNIYEFLRERSGEPEPNWLRQELVEHDAGAVISRAALDGADPVCAQALDRMVSIYGAEAGNLALKIMSTGGVYLGGGIAPRILPKLVDGSFMRAFTDKGRFDDLLERVPVRVILNERTALLGAAFFAST